MTYEGSFWVHLRLKEEVYADFGVIPIPIPIRIGVLESFDAGRVRLTAELIAGELADYLSERPAESAKYAPLLAVLAHGVGTGPAPGEVS